MSNSKDFTHGFKVEARRDYPEARCAATRLAHKRSGAQLLHIASDDPEKLFGVAFRTPPPDDTGLPHILEHTVLCGSRRYPVKDPFVEMLKRSLATYLNAFTYPDRTIYPCASMNDRDFLNLVGVYADAVFFPLITESHFKQEGHHLDFEEPGDTSSPLVVNGIVYNEMKGAYSDLAGVMDREESRSVLPDNAYGLDSGGDPKAIPSLTYEAFKAFHAKFYHPSNAFFFYYGDMPLEPILELLDRDYLSKFERISIDSSIAEQPRWTQPRRSVIPYPVSEGEDGGDKAAVLVTFLANDIRNYRETLAMFLLDSYLLDNSASPLHKALIDSKLGEALGPCGYSGVVRDSIFTAGLKGTSPERADDILALILDTCRKECRDGLNPAKVDAAMHQFELESFEISSKYPMNILNRVFSTWIYGDEPLDYVSLAPHFHALRKLRADSPRYFEDVLAKYVVDNQHRHLLTFIPDPDYNNREEREEASRMATLKSTLSKERLEAVVDEARTLEELQEAPNSPEALATLPKLKLGDVNREPMPLHCDVEQARATTLIVPNVFSNGLDYFSISFDVRDIDAELLDYLSIYTLAVANTGAAGLDYAQMAERESLHTGGLSVGADVGGHYDNTDRLDLRILFYVKCLGRNLGETLQILSDRIRKPDFKDAKRLRELLLQHRAGVKSSIASSGNAYAASAASRSFKSSLAIAEAIGGFEHIRIVDQLADDFDARRDSLIDKLGRVASFVAASPAAACHVGSKDSTRAAASFLGDFISDSPPPRADKTAQGFHNQFQPAFGIREAYEIPAAVAFNAVTFPCVGAGHPHAPAIWLAANALRFHYLWDEIRVKRGAYGVSASYAQTSGVFRMTTFRDPCVNETFDTFAAIFDFLENKLDLSPDALEQLKIGTIKTLDEPLRPAKAAGSALSRHVSGLTDKRRAKFRHNLLDLKADDIRQAVAESLRPAYASRCSCSVAGRSILDDANSRMTPAINIQKPF